MKNLKKFLYITILLIFVGSNIFAAPLSAQTVTPTDTPAPTVSVTPTDTPTPTTDPTVTPTPTPSDSPTPSIQSQTDPATPTPSPTGSIDASSSGQLTNNVNSTGITGGNSIATPSATPASNPDNSSPSNTNNGGSNSGGGGGSVNTGNAVSTTTVDNSQNYTSINSRLLFQTINIFDTDGTTIDLSTPFEIANSIVTADQNNNPVVNVQVTGIHNYAYMNNNITSVANTGQNNASGIDGQQMQINTGNAISIVSLLNKVNFNLVGSTVHVVTINIFGKLNGNVILPDITTLPKCDTCGVSINVNNQATVTNTVNSTAISGQNTISSGSGTITTGGAQSTVNLTNMVNTNIIGTSIAQLYINAFGLWNGNFLGWGNFLSQNGGQSMALSNVQQNSGNGNGGCSSCSGNVNIQNTANVVNNVNSTANTGGNNINGNGTVATGNAYSVVQLSNFVNTNFINSLGFFGFINIFGDWTGNIGDNAAFVTPTPTPTDSVQTQTAVNTSKESGGALSVEQTNNVGDYVNPGDTVTFFVKVHNTGSGMVYGTILHLDLIKDGQNLGGHDFDLGDIPVGKGKYLTTGFVLSKTAPGGLYTAHAEVDGTTGNDNTSVSATSDSTFTISGAAGNGEVLGSTTDGTSALKPNLPALGVKNDTSGAKNETATYLLWLLGLTGIHIFMRILQKREVFAYLLFKKVSFKIRLYALRMFLL